jgi:hypothetical protein
MVSPGVISLVPSVHIDKQDFSYISILARPTSPQRSGTALLRIHPAEVSLRCTRCAIIARLIAGCPPTKHVAFRLPLGVTMDEFLSGNAVDLDGTDLVQAMPVNYRPPSTDGNGVIFAIPRSPYVYNVDKARLKPPGKLWKEPMMPILQQCAQQCAGSKTPDCTSDCGCTKIDTFSNLISKSDCQVQVLRLFFSEVPYRPVFDVFQHEHDKIANKYHIRLTELNGRDDWCYIDNALAAAPLLPDGSGGSLDCDNRTAVGLFQLNTSDINVGLIWHGPQLYHFRVEFFGDTYCSLETQFKVWIYGEPVRPMVKYLTMTVTAVVVSLVLLGVYIIQNGSAVKVRDA